MRINKQDALESGKISEQFCWTDKELLQLIATTEIVIAFLEAKGPRWHLAASPMRQELERFEDCYMSRKRTQ